MKSIDRIKSQMQGSLMNAWIGRSESTKILLKVSNPGKRMQTGHWIIDKFNGLAFLVTWVMFISRGAFLYLLGESARLSLNVRRYIGLTWSHTQSSSVLPLPWFNTPPCCYKWIWVCLITQGLVPWALSREFDFNSSCSADKWIGFSKLSGSNFQQHFLELQEFLQVFNWGKTAKCIILRLNSIWFHSSLYYACMPSVLCYMTCAKASSPRNKTVIQWKLQPQSLPSV